jgi:hypothetical protein
MDQEVRKKSNPKSSEDRREFLRRAGKASLGVPATALLLSVTNKSARAWGYGYGEHTYDFSALREYFHSHYSGEYD